MMTSYGESSHLIGFVRGICHLSSVGFPSQNDWDTSLLMCTIMWCLLEQDVEQTIVLFLIWNALMITWCVLWLFHVLLIINTVVSTSVHSFRFTIINHKTALFNQGPEILCHLIIISPQGSTYYVNHSQRNVNQVVYELYIYPAPANDFSSIH